MQLDEIDLKILKHLQERGRISNVELADQVGLSPAPCLRRVRALEEAGVIHKYVTVLDPSAVNLSVTVFVQVTLDLQVEGRLEIFEQAVMRHPEILECHLMTGDADYLLRVAVPDVSNYEYFLRHTLTRVESVASIKSSFALKQIKFFTGLPIPDKVPTASKLKADGSPERTVRPGKSIPERPSKPGARTRASGALTGLPGRQHRAGSA